ncbi:MAG: FtsX-like permease family protein, partial [Actinomycetota bacterium]|nr:FtsX-like permease family protein [Actinomycetota bacterium]
VLAPIGSGTSAQTNQDDLAILPITTAQTYLVGTANLESVKAILVKARSGSQLSAAYQEIDHELLALHGIANPANADFTITAEQSIVSVATSVTTTLTYLLGSVAAVSLLVGGVGVMNIMLVSVTERRREIGLRKALGATRRAIQVQFLAEATVLGLAGGLCGVGLGELGALILPRIVGYPVSIPATATAAALVLAAVISIGFGVYPAARAARLSPIDALRSE